MKWIGPLLDQLGKELVKINGSLKINNFRKKLVASMAPNVARVLGGASHASIGNLGLSTLDKHVATMDAPSHTDLVVRLQPSSPMWLNPPTVNGVTLQCNPKIIVDNYKELFFDLDPSQYINLFSSL